MDDLRFERDVEIVVETHRERNGMRTRSMRKAPLLAFAVLAGVLALAVAGVAAGVVAATVGLGLIMLRATLSGRGIERYVHETRPAKLRVTSTAIEGASPEPLPLDRIATAYHQPWRDAEGTVCCKDARGKTVLEVVAGNEDDAAALLRALGHDVDRRRYRLQVGNPAEPTATTMIGRVAALAGAVALASFVVAAIGGASGAAIVAAMAVLVASRINDARTGECEIGADGVALTWRGATRFVPWAKVTAIGAESSCIRLVVAGETPLVVRPLGTAGTRDFLLRKDALYTRLRDARENPTTPADDALAARLARGERTAAGWQADLANVREGDYRTGGAPEEDLWRVVEDHRASPDARVGAALALRNAEGAGPRIRVAAAAVASPAVRVALERTADTEIDEDTLARVATSSP